MQNKPTNWDTYLASSHVVESKAVIGSTTYEYDDIISLKTTGASYDTFGIGNCCARTCEIEFNPTSSPARQSSVVISARLRSGSNTTSYVPKGTYYISKRQKNHITGSMKLTCYDAMLRTEETYLTESMEEDDFPKSPSTVVSEIATRIGVTLDSRNVINSSFLVEYPVDKDGDMTMREVLSRIAIANGGNWVISDNNKLRLIPLKTTATAINIGSDCSDLEKGIQSDAISMVEILNESGELIASSGTDTGKVLTVTHPDGTQAMADYILSQVTGYAQYGFTASDSIIDPCAEIGDRVTVGTTGDTITSVIVSEEISFDYQYTSNISAPDADEVEDEYPYLTFEQKLNRAVATSYSKITKTENEIKLLVAGLMDPWESGKTYAVGDLASYDGKFYRCTVANSDITFNPSHWEEIDTGIVESCVQLAVGKMTLSVSSGNTGSSITLTSGSVQIVSAAAMFETNQAHFSGTLSADKISAGSLDADNIYLKDAFAVQMYNSDTSAWETVGFVGAATGYDGQSNTKGAVLKSANGNSYAIVTNAGVRLQRGNTSFWLEDSNIRYSIAGGTSTPIGYAVFS